MISASQIAEILSLYRKYGWTLRRVLLSEMLRANLADRMETLFGATEIVSSEIDAAWFSRSSGAGEEQREAWEIRHFSETPYALIETFDADDDEEIREEARREIEAQLAERTLRKIN